MNLLIVEDEVDLVALFDCFLESIDNVVVHKCGNTDAAVQYLDDGLRPEAALIDFSSAGKLTSVDLCRYILDRAPNCRLFLMSGLNSELMKTATSDVVPIEAFFQKPFSIQDALEKIAGSGAASGRRTFGFTRYPAASQNQFETLRELLRVDPNDMAVRQLLAFSLYSAGRYRDAAEQYEIVCKGSKAGYLTHYYAGHTSARLHRFKDALAYWEQALAVAPDSGARAKVQARISQAKEMLRVERNIRDSDPKGHPHSS